MVSGTLYGRDVTAVPHSWPAQFTQVVQAGRGFWEEGGTDRAGSVPKIRDNERKRQRKMD